MTQNNLFIENLKNALNDVLKSNQYQNRNISIIDLKQTDETTFIVTTKATFTNLEFFGINNKGEYEFKTDANFVVETELNQNNTTMTQISPFTIKIEFNGDYDVKQITKQQFFNIQTIKDNKLFKDLTNQEKIEYAIEQQPKQDIIKNKKALMIEPFTIHIIYAKKG